MGYDVSLSASATAVVSCGVGERDGSVTVLYKALAINVRETHYLGTGINREAVNLVQFSGILPNF